MFERLVVSRGAGVIGAAVVRFRAQKRSARVFD